MTTLLIAGVDSTLALPVIEFGREQDWRIIGTSRHPSPEFEKPELDSIYFCDFNSQPSIKTCVDEIIEAENDSKFVCIFSIGTLTPIGKFGEIAFTDWLNGFWINGLGPLNFINYWLTERTIESDFFLTYAGNGTNSSPTHYSSYTLAKIMLIKSMEILASEYPNKTFVSLGTGWMKSKIHNATLQNSLVPPEVVAETKRRLKYDDFGDPNLIKEFLRIALSFDSQTVSGRNYSLVNDPWQEKDFWNKVRASKDSNKLRRRDFSE